ncbi:citrate lyase subunit alpha, partial [Salmonella enterica]|uniref:citrate lyase subunit alpha n=1 Tax=Salmonella enterica TaxID=28901 RepID=UPI000A4240DA
TEEWFEFPNCTATNAKVQVDLNVQADEVFDPEKITAGAIRLCSNPSDLLITLQSANLTGRYGNYSNVF